MEMEGMGDHLGKVWRLREGPGAESERKKNMQNKPNQECSITSAKVRNCFRRKRSDEQVRKCILSEAKLS